MSKQDDKKNNQGWESDLNKAVENIMSAVDIDLNEIKKNIQDTMTDISQVMKDSARQYKEGNQHVHGKEVLHHQNNRTVNKAETRPVKSPRVVKSEIVPVSKKLPGQVAHVLYSVFGGIGAVSFLAAALTFTALSLVDASFFGGALAFFLATGISFAMLYQASKIRRKNKRFKTYIRCIQGRPFCKIKELASSIQKSEAFVIKDLKKMIESQMFLEAHLDDEQNYLILNHETYRQYLSSKEVMQQKIDQQRGVEVESIEAKSQVKERTEVTEVDKAVFQGKEYIRQMRKANDLISGEEITRKLDRLEAITAKIFIYVEKNPQKLPETRKFMEYYLPATLKLIDAYQEFEEHGYEGETVKRTKLEIEQTLDTINGAFETLFDGMFEDAAMDLSTDISVLETMLAQEGLTKNF